ncbi:hypothetical protein SAM19_01589 [Brevibacillus laterosporus]|nr:hypothetical protein [Brevibacillus laterosporus]
MKEFLLKGYMFEGVASLLLVIEAAAASYRSSRSL